MFFSTTTIFDNDLSKPYYEEDLPNSHTDYGEYKITCENGIIDVLHDKASSSIGKNFFKDERTIKLT